MSIIYNIFFIQQFKNNFFQRKNFNSYRAGLKAKQPKQGL